VENVMTQPLIFLVAFATLALGSSAQAQNGAQQDGVRQVIDECDRLAASDVDPERPAWVPGVPADAVQASVAVPRCEAAVIAAPGDRRVIFQLGRVYQAAKDYEKARAQYVRADALGHSGAANNLGTLISRGLGGERDLAEARRLYEKAAERGLPIGMYNVGALYECGTGVPMDLPEARRWYEKAANGGFVPAMAKLGYFAEKGLAGTQDYAEARDWYQKAAAGGNAHAMSKLGALYERGRGGATDYAEARRWYDKAVAAGDAGAKPKSVESALIHISWLIATAAWLLTRSSPRFSAFVQARSALAPSGAAIVAMMMVIPTVARFFFGDIIRPSLPSDAVSVASVLFACCGLVLIAGRLWRWARSLVPAISGEAQA
jgi:tetratricopeptide (TPR) repeat protein